MAMEIDNMCRFIGNARKRDWRSEMRTVKKMQIFDFLGAEWVTRELVGDQGEARHCLSDSGKTATVSQSKGGSDGLGMLARSYGALRGMINLARGEERHKCTAMSDVAMSR